MYHSICEYVLPTCFLCSAKPNAVLVRLIPFSHYLYCKQIHLLKCVVFVLENSHVVKTLQGLGMLNVSVVL